MDIKRAKEDLRQQQQIRKEKIEIRGQFPEKVESFMNVAEDILEQLKQTDLQAQINENKISSFAKELGIDIKNLEKNF